MLTGISQNYQVSASFNMRHGTDQLSSFGTVYIDNARTRQKAPATALDNHGNLRGITRESGGKLCLLWSNYRQSGFDKIYTWQLRLHRSCRCLYTNEQASLSRGCTSLLGYSNSRLNVRSKVHNHRSICGSPQYFHRQYKRKHIIPAYWKFGLHNLDNKIVTNENP